jgi:16S rRNA (guanine(1405)-N(7))-methyltransferase
MEDRQKGCSLPLWQALNTRWLLLSLPTTSMSGKHSLIEKHRKLVTDILSPVSWSFKELLFPNEIVFCIQKG